MYVTVSPLHTFPHCSSSHHTCGCQCFEYRQLSKKTKRWARAVDFNNLTYSYPWLPPNKWPGTAKKKQKQHQKDESAGEDNCGAWIFEWRTSTKRAAHMSLTLEISCVEWFTKNNFLTKCGMRCSPSHSRNYSLIELTRAAAAAQEEETLNPEETLVEETKVICG